MQMLPSWKDDRLDFSMINSFIVEQPSATQGAWVATEDLIGKGFALNLNGTIKKGNAARRLMPEERWVAYLMDHCAP